MNEDSILNDDQQELIADLCKKADITNSKTDKRANCSLEIGGLHVPIRVDDHQLLFIGARLLPNILNYLVNILPQFMYPYIVAYLQELSDGDKPITINDLFNYLIDFENGNLLDSTQAEG